MEPQKPVEPARFAAALGEVISALTTFALFAGALMLATSLYAGHTDGSGGGIGWWQAFGGTIVIVAVTRIVRYGWGHGPTGGPRAKYFRNNRG